MSISIEVLKMNQIRSLKNEKFSKSNKNLVESPNNRLHKVEETLSRSLKVTVKMLYSDGNKKETPLKY